MVKEGGDRYCVEGEENGMRANFDPISTVR